jgi:hypothetical protein
MIAYLRQSMLGFSSSGFTTVPIPTNKPVVDPFEGFEQYSEPNWDGFDALPILSRTIADARKLYRFIEPDLRRLKRPNIAPGSDGNIGFEWYYRGGEIKKIFIEVQPQGKVRGYCVRASGAIEKLRPTDLDLALPIVGRLLSELAQGV